MSWLMLSEIAAMVQGRLIGNDVPVESVSTDTRSLDTNQLFVALKGLRFDGHDFALRDPAPTAAAMLVSRRLDTALAQILVDDTQLALSRLAERWRERLDLKVIGLTGSNGKTTVKEMCASILAQKGEVFATPGNLNNHIGVPLTLLSIRAKHDFAVVEMGANHPGEIGGLTDIVQPHVALITNAAPAHLEGFGSLDGVAQAKAEIFNGLDQKGLAIINADDAYADFWRRQVGERSHVSFGLEREADVRGSWQPGEDLYIETPEGSVAVSLALVGRHNAMNALAASAATIALGVQLRHVKQGLESMQPVSGRLTPKRGINNTWILDDSYNANPGSFGAALEVLRECSGEPWLVLGDMAELGEFGESLHRQVGALAQEYGVRRLYATGPLTKSAVKAFGKGAVHINDVDALLQQLRKDLHSGVYVLVKGSRTMHMEHVVCGLLKREQTMEVDEEKENAA